MIGAKLVPNLTLELLDLSRGPTRALFIRPAR